MMFLLGLILPVCFVVPYTGATIPTQWPLLAAFLVPSLWKDNYFGTFHWLGLGFFLYACVSMFWSLDYGYGLWIVAIWTLSFWWGSTQRSLSSLWTGIAFGLLLNLPIAIAQKFGWSGVMYFSTSPAGLLYNSTLYGILSTVVLIQTTQNRQWWLSAALVPGLVLANSFGAFAILALTAIARYIHWTLAVACIIAGALWVVTGHPLGSSADPLRLQIWSVAWQGLTLLGWGSGSFSSVFLLRTYPEAIHPEFVHNDYLQLWFEYGVAACAVYALLAAALSARTYESNTSWYALFAFVVSALFYFPLYTPITAFLLCATTGHILRRYDPLGCALHRRGYNLVAWVNDSRPKADITSDEDVPNFART